jgi:hypothetical protein
LFTLHFPIQLPPEHTFFDNGQYPVPPLPGGLSLKCISHENSPVLLQISGFATEQNAMDFCPVLRGCLRGACLDSKHSITPSNTDAIVTKANHFDGSRPTVTQTQIGAMPYYATMSQTNGLHISVLSGAIGACMTHGLPAKLAAKPELSLSLELFSDFEFAGGRNAQFVMLLTALEVLVTNTSSKGKRGGVIKLVKDALSAAGHVDPKSVGKQLDGLYVARNSLIHAANPVTHSQLAELREIVRMTLKALTL